MKIPHPALGKKFCTSGEFRLAKNILSNHLGFGSTTISSIYKERWQIEVFFKTLKQNLKVKTFIGVSKNALRIQIWTALIALLVIKWLHHRSKVGWSFSNMVRQLADFV